VAAQPYWDCSGINMRRLLMLAVVSPDVPDHLHLREQLHDNVRAHHAWHCPHPGHAATITKRPIMAAGAILAESCLTVDGEAGHDCAQSHAAGGGLPAFLLLMSVSTVVLMLWTALLTLLEF